MPVVKFPIESCTSCPFFKTYPVEDNMIETACEKEAFKRGDGYDPGDDIHDNCPFAGRGRRKSGPFQDPAYQKWLGK